MPRRFRSKCQRKYETIKSYLKLTTHAINDSQQFLAKGSILDAMFDV